LDSPVEEEIWEGSSGKKEKIEEDANRDMRMLEEGFKATERKC